MSTATLQHNGAATTMAGWFARELHVERYTLREIASYVRTTAKTSIQPWPICPSPRALAGALDTAPALDEVAPWMVQTQAA
jgi:hypothetical protein